MPATTLCCAGRTMEPSETRKSAPTAPPWPTPAPQRACTFTMPSICCRASDHHHHERRDETTEHTEYTEKKTKCKDREMVKTGRANGMRGRGASIDHLMVFFPGLFSVCSVCSVVSRLCVPW